jgi:uncharacterized GH25 family protein
MRLKSIFLLSSYLLLFAIFSSCTKAGKTIAIKGRVLNPINGKGIEGAQLRLLKLTPNGFQEKEKVAKSIETDVNGNFELDQLGLTRDFVLSSDNVKGNYRLGWYESGKLLTAESRIEIKKGKTTNIDYYALPFGQLRENVQNIIDPQPNDLMQYRRKAWFDKNYGSWTSYKVGLYSDNGSELQLVPMGTWYYETKLTRNGEDFYFYDSIFVNDFGVTTVIINY